MFIDRPALKRRSKALLSLTKPSPYLVALVYLLAIWALRAVQVKFSAPTVDEAALQSALAAAAQGGELVLDNAFRQAPAALSLLGTVLALMVPLVNAGWHFYSLRVTREQESRYDNLFVAFSDFATITRVLLLAFLSGFFIFLWSLLLIVPGFIAAYRYRQALFILLDNPQMRPIDCISASKELMRGRKAELFTLDLSFWGWYLLALLLFPVSIYVQPYTGFVYADYYNALMQGRAQTL